MGDAIDKIYHTLTQTFLYNVLFPAKLIEVMRSLRPTNSVYSSPVAVGATLELWVHRNYIDGEDLIANMKAFRVSSKPSEHTWVVQSILYLVRYASAGGIHPYGTI